MQRRQNCHVQTHSMQPQAILHREDKNCYVMLIMNDAFSRIDPSAQSKQHSAAKSASIVVVRPKSTVLTGYRGGYAFTRLFMHVCPKC